LLWIQPINFIRIPPFGSDWHLYQTAGVKISSPIVYWIPLYSQPNASNFISVGDMTHLNRRITKLLYVIPFGRKDKFIIIVFTCSKTGFSWERPRRWQVGHTHQHNQLADVPDYCRLACSENRRFHLGKTAHLGLPCDHPSRYVGNNIN